LSSKNFCKGLSSLADAKTASNSVKSDLLGAVHRIGFLFAIVFGTSSTNGLLGSARRKLMYVFLRVSSLALSSASPLISTHPNLLGAL
jgi:hypothetical protein